jgi:hypothetical protein
MVELENGQLAKLDNIPAKLDELLRRISANRLHAESEIVGKAESDDDYLLGRSRERRDDDDYLLGGL